jgi:hypothetical protein
LKALSLPVIPGHREAVSPESITTSGAIMDKSVVMDPGQPLRGFRDDSGEGTVGAEALNSFKKERAPSP